MKHLFTLSVLLLVIMVMVLGCDSETPTATPVPPTATPAQVEASAAESAPMGDAANGQTLFATTCSACHGPAGEGVQGLGKDMTKSEFIAGLSDEELLAFLIEGRRVSDPLNTTGIDMPPKGGNPAITDEQLVDIVAYIRSIHVN